VVLGQALGLALLGFVPGWVLSLGLYALTSSLANLPIEMNALRMLLVLGLTMGMCSLSGLGALGKVRQADPAALF
jgi:putative ABC transport system permease protein